jgi:multidrug efflux pump subunit AcrA (membrane-fusion protein)
MTDDTLSSSSSTEIIGAKGSMQYLLGRLRQVKMKAIVSNLVHYKLLSITILGCSILLGALIVVTGPKSAPQERVEKAWPVSVKIAEPDVREPVLAAYGKVESRQVANLKTSITAPVAEVVTSEGSWVNTGDLLVKLDEREMQLALIVATAEYKKRVAQFESAKTDFELAKKVTGDHRALKEIAEAKLERHLDLYKTKVVSDSILDEARKQASERSIMLERHLADLKIFPNIIEQHQASVAEGKALVDRAQLDVEQTNIIAPFSGRVIETYVAPGDRVLPGTAVIQVADYGGLEVRTAIPSTIGFALRQKFNQGQVVRARGVLDGRDIAFELVRLSGDVKAGQSGLDAFFKTASDDLLDIGRVINLNITLPPEQSVVVLPVQSIYENNRVYRVIDDRLEGIEVQQVGDYVGEDGRYQILIRSPEISAGDRLITTQLPRAITGLLVDAIDASKFKEALAVETNLE